MKTLLTIFAALFITSTAFAQDQAYCNAALETAKSQADLLRTPQVALGVTESPLVGSPAQAVAGFTESVQGLRKAGRVLEVGRATCRLYKAQEDSALAIQYAMPILEREALQQRLTFDDEALRSIDELIADSNRLLQVQNTTRQAVYGAQSAKARILTDVAAVNTALATIVIPSDVSSESIQALVNEEQAATILAQDANTRLQKTQNFDVQLVVGVRHSVFDSSVGGYGGFSATWSPASKASDRHLANAALSQELYDRTNPNGVTRQTQVLHQQVTQSLAAWKGKLVAVQAQQSVIDENLAAVDGVDTPSANIFRASLRADSILQRTELLDAQYRISKLENFLMN